MRPWDTGKDGIKTKKHQRSNDKDEDKEWTYKPEREPMSQEQWNEKMRAERNLNFAPYYENTEKISHNPFKSTHTHIDTFEPDNETLKFSSKKKPFIRRNIDEKDLHPPGAQIQNELSDDEQYPSHSTNIATKRDGVATIPPPATYEYFNAPPPPTKYRKTHENTEQFESSIEAGLKFLRKQSDKGTATTKMKWSTNASY